MTSNGPDLQQRLPHHAAAFFKRLPRRSGLHAAVALHDSPVLPLAAQQRPTVVFPGCGCLAAGACRSLPPHQDLQPGEGQEHKRLRKGDSTGELVRRRQHRRQHRRLRSRPGKQRGSRKQLSRARCTRNQAALTGQQPAAERECILMKQHVARPLPRRSVHRHTTSEGKALDGIRRSHKGSETQGSRRTIIWPSVASYSYISTPAARYSLRVSSLKLSLISRPNLTSAAPAMAEGGSCSPSSADEKPSSSAGAVCTLRRDVRCADCDERAAAAPESGSERPTAKRAAGLVRA